MSASKTALLTGASRGLGRAIAARLVAEGYRVVGISRAPEQAASLEGLSWLQLDLSDPGQVAAAVQGENPLFASIDLLINNAGFADAGAVVDLPFDTIPRHLQAMVAAPIALTQVVLPGMLERGSGAIVNVASLAVELPIPFLSLYNTAKAGLAGYSRSLLLELAGTGVQVIDFRPGDYRTTFYDSSTVCTPEEGDFATAWTRMQRHAAQGPDPVRAADDLWKALAKGKSGTVRSGEWFQAGLAAWAGRHLPEGWMRKRIRRYYGLKAH